MLIKEIYRRFKSYGFHAEYFKYDTLLSLPNPKKRNHAYIIDDEGNELFKSKGTEDILEPEEKDPTAFPAFHAYAPNGTVQV